MHKIGMLGLAAAALAMGARPVEEELTDDWRGKEPEPVDPERNPEPVENEDPKPGQAAISYEDGIPSRVCVNPASEFFHDGVSSMIGVRIDGEERQDVREYDLMAGAFKANPDRETWRWPRFEMHVYWREKPSRQILRRLRRIGA